MDSNMSLNLHWIPSTYVMYHSWWIVIGCISYIGLPLPPCFIVTIVYCSVLGDSDGGNFRWSFQLQSQRNWFVVDSNQNGHTVNITAVPDTQLCRLFHCQNRLLLDTLYWRLLKIFPHVSSRFIDLLLFINYINCQRFELFSIVIAHHY